MGTVTIGSDSRPLQDADSQWVTQEINGRRRDKQSVCVHVSVQDPPVSVVLGTPTCGGGGGGGRSPNSEERRIFELWERHHLNTPDFTAGDLVAFLKQLRSLL